MSAKYRWLLATTAAALWTLFFFPWNPNQSYEHYWLSGPLISFIHTAPWIDRIVGVPLTAILLMSIFLPVVRLNVVTGVLSLVGLAAWFGLSIKMAVDASC